MKSSIKARGSASVHLCSAICTIDTIGVINVSAVMLGTVNRSWSSPEGTADSAAALTAWIGKHSLMLYPGVDAAIRDALRDLREQASSRSAPRRFNRLPSATSSALIRRRRGAARRRFTR